MRIENCSFAAVAEALGRLRGRWREGLDRAIPSWARREEKDQFAGHDQV